jgi:hypothetical protein
VQPSFNAQEQGIRVFDAFVLRLDPQPFHPPLQITRSGQHVIVSWSTNFSGFRLEGSTLLETWMEVANPPLVLGSQHSVVERAGASSRFYRLRR